MNFTYSLFCGMVNFQQDRWYTEKKMSQAQQFPLMMRSSLLALSIVSFPGGGGERDQTTIKEHILAMYEEEVSLNMLGRILRYLMHRGMVRVQHGPNTWAITEYGQQGTAVLPRQQKASF